MELSMDTPRRGGGNADSHVAAVEIDLAAVRAVIAPLYDDKTLATGESFLAHADGIVGIVRRGAGRRGSVGTAYLFGAHEVRAIPEEWLRSRWKQRRAIGERPAHSDAFVRAHTPREGSARGPGRSAAQRCWLRPWSTICQVLSRRAQRWCREPSSRLFARERLTSVRAHGTHVQARCQPWQRDR